MRGCTPHPSFPGYPGSYTGPLGLPLLGTVPWLLPWPSGLTLACLLALPRLVERPLPTPGGLSFPRTSGPVL